MKKNCDLTIVTMFGGVSGRVLTLLAVTLGCSRGQDWLTEQEPAHRTDYLNALERESLGRNSDNSESSSDVELFREFHGNSTHTDHFKLLKEDGSSVLVGARNVIYNLSLPNLLEFTEEVSQSQSWIYLEE